MDTNGTALVRREPSGAMLDPRAACAPASLVEIRRMADIVAASGLYGVRSPDDAMIRMVTGMELGLSCMQALRGVYVINNRPSLDAALMTGVCLSRPDLCEYFVLVESSATSATYETKRKGAPAPVRMTFTIEQAKRANLTGKGTWASFPENMLRARASSNLARAVYPDLLNGLYTPDEIEDIAAPQRAAAVATVVEAKAAPVEAPRTVEPQSDPSVIAGLFDRLAAANDDAAFRAIAADAVAAHKSGAISTTDFAALKEAHRTAKARNKVAPAPATAEHDAEPVGREPGSDG